MGIFKLDPPPATNDAGVLRNYINDLYDEISRVIHTIDSDNMTDEFLSSINLSKESEVN